MAPKRLAVGEWGVVDGTGQNVAWAEGRQGEIRAVFGSVLPLSPGQALGEGA